MQNNNINIDITKDGELIVCKECRGLTFEQVMFVYRISALLSPQGVDSLFPAAVLRCTNCKTILSETMPVGLEEKLNNEIQENTEDEEFNDIFLDDTQSMHIVK